jgi:hypothetical protein
MESACSSETLVNFQQTTYRYISEPVTLRTVKVANMCSEIR